MFALAILIWISELLMPLFENWMKYVLFRFNAIKFSWNHSFIRLITIFNSLWSCSLLLFFIIILVSSANMIGVAEGSTTLGKSFIYNKKSKGPKIEPCGTPWVIFIQFDNAVLLELCVVIWTLVSFPKVRFYQFYNFPSYSIVL